MAVQTDGKILVAGSNWDGTGGGTGVQWALTRLNSNGTIDASFGTSGTTITNFEAASPFGDYPKAIAVQSDGKIVVAGRNFFDMALARYNTNGSLDTTFGIGGKVTTSFDGSSNTFAPDDIANAVAIQADVTKSADVRRLFAETKAAFGTPGILVNNAGVYRFDPLEEVTEAEFHRQFDTNVLGVILSMKHEVRVMQGQGSGSIVNISSTYGHEGAAGASIYVGSKHAVEGITKSVALEVAKSGIRVNAVAPGPTDTGMLTRFTGTPENKAALTGILTYHVVPGKLDAAALKQQIAAGGGKASLKTVAGGTLTASAAGNGIAITDEKGGQATVTIADVLQSNGVIHVVDKVLLPGTAP